MEIAEREDLTSVYSAIMTTFVLGKIRFWGAEAAISRLSIALLEFRTKTDRTDSASTDDPVYDQLSRIPYSSYEAYIYVTNISHLIYATSIFDTFLSETVQFLFHIFPDAIGKDQQVPLKAIINAKTLKGLISSAAKIRTREISFLPLKARLDYLKERFGLRINLSEDVYSSIENYAELRNEIVHDQGIYDICYDDKGHIIAEQKSCPHHPSKITSDDVTNAFEVYNKVFLAVSEAIVDQVLKMKDHPSVKKLLEKL